MNNLIIVNAYIDSPKKLTVLQENIQQLKKSEYKILLISNSVISTEIVSLVEYYIFSGENLLLPLENSPLRWYADLTETVHVHVPGVNLAILKSLNIALNFTQNLGFDKFFFIEYDNILSDSDLPLISGIFKSLTDKNKKLWFCEFTSYENSAYESRIFAGDVNFILNKICLPKTYGDWNSMSPYSTNTDTLEFLFHIMFGGYKSETLVFNGYNSQFFGNSKIDVFPSNKIVNIGYNNDNPNNPLVFIIGNDSLFKIKINNIIVKEIFLHKNEIFKHYFFISDEWTVVTIFTDDGVFEHKISLSNILDFKKTTERFSLLCT